MITMVSKENDHNTQTDLMGLKRKKKKKKSTIHRVIKTKKAVRG